MGTKILITGGSGMIGQALSVALSQKGHQVSHLSRHPSTDASYPSFKWDIGSRYIDPRALKVDVIIHLSGEGIANNRWTEKQKQKLMAELDKIPQKQSIEIESVKLDEGVLKSITELNQKAAAIIQDFGKIYVRKKEIELDIISMDEFLVQGQEELAATNKELRDILDALDEQYPQGRINLQDGTIQYQPGAPTRKQQQAEQQAQQQKQSSGNGMKVVKE